MSYYMQDLRYYGQTVNFFFQKVYVLRRFVRL
jgi:hypothetical protein